MIFICIFWWLWCLAYLYVYWPFACLPLCSVCLAFYPLSGWSFYYLVVGDLYIVFFFKSVCFYIYLYSFETSSSNVLKYFLPDCALILISYECPLMRIFILMKFRLINFRWCLYLDSVLSLIHFSKLCPETLLHLFVISSAQLLSYVRLFVAPWAIAHQAPLSMKFSGQEYWSGCHFLLLGIFPIQESNPSL